MGLRTGNPCPQCGTKSREKNGGFGICKVANSIFPVILGTDNDICRNFSNLGLTNVVKMAHYDYRPVIIQ